MLTIAHQDILWILETDFLLLDEGPTDDINDSAAEYEKKKKKKKKKLFLKKKYKKITLILHWAQVCHFYLKVLKLMKLG